MTPVAGTTTNDERGRRITGNRRRSAVAGEGCRAGVDYADKVGSRRDTRQRVRRVAVLLIKVLKKNRCRGGKLSARREPHDADLVGIDVPFFGIGAHHAHGLLGVIYSVSRGVVAVLAQPVAQNDRGDAVVIEEGDKVCTLAAYVERIVPTARDDDHSRAGVD